MNLELSIFYFQIYYKSAEWREVDPKTKSKYQKKADKAREDYEKIKDEYEKKYGSIKKIARKRK